MTRTPYREQIVRVGDTRAVIARGGGGPVVVVLASMLVMARSYLWPFGEFTKRFHTVIVQAPGSGRASRVARPWSMEQYADWTGELLEALDLRDVTLVGHSNSGPVAVILAAKDPRRLARLVLADSTGADRAFSLVRILLARGVDCFHEPELTLAAWNHVVFNPVFHFANFWEQVRLSARTDLEPWARRIAIPTLIGWGAKDNTYPLRCGRLLREWIPGSVLRVSRGGSHDWLVDHPAEFAEVLGDFIGDSAVAHSLSHSDGRGAG